MATEYPVAGSYGLGSVIMESKVVDGCRERRRFRIIDEGHRDGTNKYVLSITVACSRAVRAKLDCYAGDGTLS